MLNIKDFLKIIKKNNRWIKISSLIFLASFFLGFIGAEGNMDFVIELTEPFFESLEDLAQDILNQSPGRGITLLFFNNLFASLRVIFLGVFLGITPFFGLFLNGGILGVVTSIMAGEGFSPFLFLTLGILPHGALEVPAFLISAAFGLKLGYHLMFPLEGKSRWESLAHIFKEIFGVLPFIVVLLMVAAVIEILITPLLLRSLF